MQGVQVGDKNILWLDVSMNHISILQVQQSFHDLGNDVPGTFLIKAFLSAQLLVKVTVLAVVQDHVDVLSVVKVTMKLDDVGMIQSPLNL